MFYYLSLVYLKKLNSSIHPQAKGLFPPPAVGVTRSLSFPICGARIIELALAVLEDCRKSNMIIYQKHLGNCEVLCED